MSLKNPAPSVIRNRTAGSDIDKAAPTLPLTGGAQLKLTWMVYIFRTYYLSGLTSIWGDSVMPVLFTILHDFCYRHIKSL